MFNAPQAALQAPKAAPVAPAPVRPVKSSNNVLLFIILGGLFMLGVLIVLFFVLKK